MEISKIKIYDGFANMDFEKVTQMLSQANWSTGIGIEEVKQGACNSALVVEHSMGTFKSGTQG